MTTIDNIMALADAYAISVADAPHHPTPLLRAMAVEKIEKAREALRTKLEEIAQPIQTPSCTSNCDNCTYSHGSPAHAGYCYMFYAEPHGVCAQWKDANPNIQKYPEKDISAQPVREHYDKTEMNAFVQELYVAKMREGKHGHYEILFHVVHKAIERAHGIGGDK